MSAARFFAFVFIACGIMSLQAKQYYVLRSMAESIRVVGEHEMTTYWTSGGIQRHITTEALVGESDDALLVRHTAAVKVALKVWPRDQG